MPVSACGRWRTRSLVKGRPEVRQAPGYFQANQTRMRYDYFRETGYPIGSGTVESAANNVVHHRMQRPGRGWQQDNAQVMLAGLSELHSGRFDGTSSLAKSDEVW
jgi:hypothetical protein